MAEWGALGDGETAMIEMARTSGLALLSLDERDPLRATTFGLGEVIREALDAGFRSFIVGIGGSATNDAGAGMAQALGVKAAERVRERPSTRRRGASRSPQDRHVRTGRPCD